MLSEKTPGQAMPEWTSYETRLHNGKEAGFKSPDGKFFTFETNESLAHLRLDNNYERSYYVKLQNGTLVPIDLWMSEQEGN